MDSILRLHLTRRRRHSLSNLLNGLLCIPKNIFHGFVNFLFFYINIHLFVVCPRAKINDEGKGKGRRGKGKGEKG